MIAPNSIINGDCLEVMKDIADHSVDCIICDLPYAITNCHWDKLIPFDLLWEQYKRIIKPNGAICLFGSQPFTSALVMSNPKWFKYEWIWVKNKPSGFVQAKNKPMSKHENILIFSEGVTVHAMQSERRMIFFPQNLIEINKLVSGARPSKGAGGVTKRPSHKNKIIQSHTNYPTSDIYFSKLDKTAHPTQKPVALIEYLIKTYTLEGELILDNTSGSGTLAIACINTNRQYICIEKDEHYFEVMRDKIANHDPFAPVKTKKPKREAVGQLNLFL